MTGVAAIAICAAFTSCSKNEELYNPEQIEQNAIAQVYENYNQAFIAAFGQPAANHNWGFIDYSKASTRTADPRGNMWAAEGWNVPPVISNAQKDIVRRYFQQNTPLEYNDPGWSKFWIQQVYKGGTKTTDGSLTTEKYIIGNDDEVTGGDHMDHLCSKSENGTEDHVNDFNNSDNNDWEGRMLMVGSSTYSFGYINSNATAIHYDKAALVNWRVIAQWAVDNNLEESVENSVLNDGWNRSYMGFDWEQALPDYCYKPILDYSVDWSGDLPLGFPVLGYETFEFEGNTYRFLSANANEYAYDSSEPVYHGKVNYNDVNDVTNDLKRDLLSKGYLPYSDTFKDWIKLSTGSDGYYSDWIVTLTEAKQDDEPEWDIRIIAEDLNDKIIESEGDPDDSDWDFNDVVLDVKFLGDDKVRIRVTAAGATLPIRINGEDDLEVHGLYGQPTNIMINTGAAAAGYPAQAYENKYPAAATFERTIAGVDASYGKDIKIEVKKNVNGVDKWFELEAKPGQPASKMGVMPDYEYCSERQDIRGRYTYFIDWVAKQNPVFWWRPVNQ